MKFVDDSTLKVEGIGDVSIRGKNGEHSPISNVLYIPEIKGSLLSKCQFLEKNYKIHMEDKVLRVLYSKGDLILKAYMSNNRNLKIGLNVIEHGCLARNTSIEEWIWHYSFGHLNFRDLNSMLSNGIISSSPKIHIPL